MRNIMLIIEYDGTQYSGWQRQNHVLSVEEAVEKTIIKVLNEEIKVLGCSRTDKGVHAMGYVLNFFTNSKIPAHGIKYALNNKLPRDRKSTRLNSSHANISYAVFCLKKKKKIR